MSYKIFVQEHSSDQEIELCRVGSNPDAIIEGLRKKTLMVDTGRSNRRTKMPKYTSVRAEELT